MSRRVSRPSGRLLTGAGPLGTVELGNGSRTSLWRSRALSSCRRFGWAVVASTSSSSARCALRCSADDGGGLVGWVESTRGVPVAGARRLHLRQGHPRRQPRHARRQPGPVRAALAARRAPTRCARSARPRALGGAARDGAAEPRRPLHAEPDAGRREGRGDAAAEATATSQARVALARAPQAPLGAGDGRRPTLPRADDGKAPALAATAALADARRARRQRGARGHSAARAACPEAGGSGCPAGWARCSCRAG